MANYLVKIAAFSFLVGISVNSEELVGRPFHFKIFDSTLPTSEVNTYQDTSIPLPAADTGNFDSNRGAIESYSKDVNKKYNSEGKLNVVSDQSKTHNPISNEKELYNKKDKQNIFKKITTSKPYPTEKLKRQLPLKYDDNAPEVSQPQAAVQLPLLDASNDSPFAYTWPKYLADSIQPAFPFPELDMRKDPWYSGTEHMLSIQENTNSREAELESHKERGPQETQEIKKVHINLENGKHQNSINHHPSATQLKLNNTKNPVLHLLTKQYHSESALSSDYQNSPAENSKAFTQKKIVPQRTFSEDKGRFQDFSFGFERDSEVLPWDFPKTRNLAPVMPFPELHETRQRTQNTDVNLNEDAASQKSLLSLSHQKRTPDVAGPILYPQSRFEKEFHVPFF